MKVLQAMKVLLGLLIFFSTRCFSQGNEEGLLLSYSSKEDNGDMHYTTLFLTVNDNIIKLEKVFPFVIIPDKSENKDGYYQPTGKLFFLQVDTLSYSYSDKEFNFKMFDNLDSVNNFKSKCVIDTAGPPTEEDVRIEMQKEKEKNNWDQETYDDELEMALNSRDFYLSSGIEIIYIFYPFITLNYTWGDYGGGAHANWGEKTISDKIEELFPNNEQARQIQDNEKHNYENNYQCCEITDSIFNSLQKEAHDGNFIDAVGSTSENLSLAIDDPDDSYSILDWVNGEPHCLVRADAFAGYAESGDYYLTVQLDNGVIDKHYKNKGKHEISDPNGNYSLTISENTLRVFNQNEKLLFKYKLNNFSKVILEEWAFGNTLKEWGKALGK